ncbi:MAG: hypothetical protein U0Q03_14820 [Acidimicrobiales bacterium]
MADAPDPTPDPTPDPSPRRELVHHLLAGVAVLAAVAMMLGLFLVQRVGTTYRDGLEITADGASLAALSATSAESLASDLVDLSSTTGDALDEARDLALVAADTTASLGDAFGTNIADAVTGTSSIADRLADLVEAIERFIPGDRDSLAEDLRTLSTGLEPVPDQLRTLSTQLDDGSTSLTDAADTLATVVTQLDQLTASIDEARDRLTEVEGLSADLGERAGRALDRSSTDLWLVRLLVAVVGLGVIASAVAARRTLDRVLA